MQRHRSARLALPRERQGLDSPPSRPNSPPPTPRTPRPTRPTPRPRSCASTPPSAQAAATLEPAHDRPIVVFHDAYGYFARAFDVEIAGSIALGDAAAPGAQRLRALQETIGAEQIACVFREPQHDASIAESVAADAGVGIGTLDPSGSSLTYGPALYETLLTTLATGIADCVAASG
jgi:ABC-type Zn2+ transport system substrate-binding protein/surface adhesin